MTSAAPRTQGVPDELTDAASLDVVIVSYRCQGLLRDCLLSLRRHPSSHPVRHIVVDNASGDGTVEMLAEEFPEVTVIEAEKNLGFGAANNRAIRRGSSTYVLALNPDTRLTPGGLDRLIEFMESRPEVGICGCRLELEDGSFDHAAKRSFPSPLSALGHFTGVSRLVPARGVLAQYRAPSVEAGRVDAVNGAFMLIRRDALTDVGLFDEGYWMYMEDLDLCYRFARAGWITWYEPSVTVVHVKAGTTGRNRQARLNYAFHYGMYRFYRKYYAPERSTALNWFVYAGIALKLGFSIPHSAFRRRFMPATNRFEPVEQADGGAASAPVAPVRPISDEGRVGSGTVAAHDVSERVAARNGTDRRSGARITERTAIAHDWFQGFHGSERVVEAIRSGLFGLESQPDIFTFHAALELLPPELARSIIKQSKLGMMPGMRQRGHASGQWRYLLPYMPLYFRSLDLSKYDLVISSSHACAVNVRPRDDALHVCYCHTPMRYAWLPETDERETTVNALGLRALRGWLRRVDLDASTRPDSYVANSEAVRERIRRFYGREAAVIHPPVDVSAFQTVADDADRDGFLWAHRLVSYKRPDLVVEAFRQLPYPLTMVGVGPLEDSLRGDLPPNVELRGWVSRAELAGLYSKAQGFLHLGEEDFGISMVEALASGTPVIAVNRGGARDIIRDGIDGLLIEDASVEAVREAIDRLTSIDWDRDALAERARDFSRERFLERLGSHLAGLGAAVELPSS